jgi:aspartate/methionine/tyrosine aminotransferase
VSLPINPLFAGIPTSIFEEMSGLARANGAINLGQGFPDAPGPESLRRKAAEFVLERSNQYPPMRGLPELRQAAARHYHRTQGLGLDWEREVTVTSGATEALACAFFALLQPGDEVVLLQPLYDAYAPLIRRAGGTLRFVRLEPPHWRITREALQAAFTSKTRMVVFNSPMNPTGVVVPDDDLQLLAEFCIAHDAVAVCDEVWEQVVFDGRVHQPLMALPGMRERTVKIGSAGKMFAMTGWKVGFLCAAPGLSDLMAKAHQYLTFTTPPNLQAAVAWGLENDREWFRTMPADLQRSRDRLTVGLEIAGYAVLPSQGTYFLNVDLAASGVNMPDREFTLRLVREAGVASIPVSSFYEQDPVTSILRLCFAKSDETLDEAVRRLALARQG